MEARKLSALCEHPPMEILNTLLDVLKCSFTDWQAFITFRNHPEPRPYGPKRADIRSWWFMILSPFLFWMPQIYLNDLQEIWIDDGEVPKVNVRLWNEFITTLRNDWEKSTTPVSRFLTVSSAYMFHWWPFIVARTWTRQRCSSRLTLAFWLSKALIRQGRRNPRHKLLRISPPLWVWPRTSHFKYWLEGIGRWRDVLVIAILPKLMLVLEHAHFHSNPWQSLGHFTE